MGGIAGFYDISTFLLAMQSVKCVELTICTSENHWLENKHLIEELINERVVVVHEDSDNLEQYYREADMSLLCKKMIHMLIYHRR